MKEVLDLSIEIVSYIKVASLNSHLFKLLCQDMQYELVAQHECLIVVYGEYAETVSGIKRGSCNISQFQEEEKFIKKVSISKISTITGLF